MRLRVIIPTELDGERFEVGAVLTGCPPAAAARLLAAGAVEDTNAEQDGSLDRNPRIRRMRGIAAAIDRLDTDDPTLWTRDGSPKIHALRAAADLGCVTVEERDWAWADRAARG